MSCIEYIIILLSSRDTLQRARKTEKFAKSNLVFLQKYKKRKESGEINLNAGLYLLKTTTIIRQGFKGFELLAKHKLLIKRKVTLPLIKNYCTESVYIYVRVYAWIYLAYVTREVENF